MKRYSVRFLHRARLDFAVILAWLSERSPAGAARLVLSMERTIERIKQFPLAHSTAPESEACGVELRQAFFKTPQGKRYRLILRVIDQEVWVLRVRGPGQPPLTPDEIDL